MSARDTLASTVVNVTVISDIAVLRALGRSFLNDEAQEFKRMLSVLHTRAIYDLVVDLSACDYISSEGLGAIAEAWEWCQEHNNSRMCVALNRADETEAVNLFEITGLSRSIGASLQPSVSDGVRFIKEFRDNPRDPR
jgi:anti-anti-sigma factor